MKRCNIVLNGGSYIKVAADRMAMEDNMLYAAIAGQPTVDAVEVVRCKDCKHCTVTADGIDGSANSADT